MSRRASTMRRASSVCSGHAGSRRQGRSHPSRRSNASCAHRREGRQERYRPGWTRRSARAGTGPSGPRRTRRRAGSIDGSSRSPRRRASSRYPALPGSRSPECRGRPLGRNSAYPATALRMASSLVPPLARRQGLGRRRVPCVLLRRVPDLSRTDVHLGRKPERQEQGNPAREQPHAFANRCGRAATGRNDRRAALGVFPRFGAASAGRSGTTSRDVSRVPFRPSCA